MRLNVVLWPTTELHLYDIAVNVNSMLIEAGHESSVKSCFDDTCTNVVIGVVGYGRHNMNILPGSIIVQMEQLYNESPWCDAFYKSILTNPLYKVVDYNYHNQKWLKQNLDLNVPIMTMGWCNELKSIENDGVKDIDVLFFGGINHRRWAFIQKIVEKGINCVYRNNDLHGQEKMNLISRAKIVINCHYYEIGLLEWPRVQHLLINGAFVISEDSINKDEYRNYCDVIFTKFGDPEDMANTVATYLEHEDYIKSYAREAREKLRKQPSIFPKEVLQ